MATITYYALESKKTTDYRHYYFCGYDDAGNSMVSVHPADALGFHHTKEIKHYLKEHPSLAEQFNIQTIFTNEKPRYYVPTISLLDVDNLSPVKKVV